MRIDLVTTVFAVRLDEPVATSVVRVMSGRTGTRET